MTTPGSPSSAERELVRKLFEAHGVQGQLHAALPYSGDELVIVLSRQQTDEWGGNDEYAMTRQLMDLLHRKVWIVRFDPIWWRTTEPL